MAGGNSDRQAGATGAARGKGPAAPARLLWLDALKGVGILAVVAGHVWTRGTLRDAVYAFHMPLFFLASGFTLRATPWRKLLPRLASGMLVPFACFAALLLAADFGIEALRGVRPIFASLGEGVWTILFATERTRGPFTILWFIPALLIARLAWNAVALRVTDPDDKTWLFVAAAALGASVVLPRLTSHSPLALLPVPAALLLLWLGALWRAREGETGRPAVATMLALLGLAALTILPPVNMKIGDVGLPLLSLAGAAGVTWWLARGLRAAPEAVQRGFAALGRASLVVMYCHVAFIHYGAPYAPKWLLFLFALIGSTLVDRLARLHPAGRRLLLGERG